MIPPSQTPEQRRAADALKTIVEIRDKPQHEKLRRHYRSYVERLAPAILMNGLGQALASERSGAEERKKTEEQAHGLLFDNLQNWLCREGGVYPAKPKDVLKAITERGETEYLRAQAEALAWLVWHKKFSQAYLPRPTDKET